MQSAVTRGVLGIVGIGIVLAMWTIVGLILASVGAVVLGAMTAFFTRKVRRFRWPTIVAVSAYPFVCLAWAGAVFVFQAAVNEMVLHRDPGLGDTWECPLPNGYALLMIDDRDYGWVYNPDTQTPGAVGEQEDAIAGIAVVQVAGPYILGRVNGKAFQFPEVVNGVVTGVKNQRPDSFFLLDTKSGRHESYSNYSDLVTAAQSRSIQTNLEPIAKVYGHYRYTWFDLFAPVLFLTPPTDCAFLLFLWILYLRKKWVLEGIGAARVYEMLC